MDSRAGVSRRLFVARSGFTLIELVIVSAIVPVITIAFISLIVATRRSADHMDAHADARQRVTGALRQWRVDVALADRIEIAEGGESLTSHRVGAGGDPLTARYALDGEGQFLREARGGEDPPTRVLVSGVSELRFSRAGEGYGVEWAVRRGSGGERLEWTYKGFATPLSAPRPRGLHGI